MKFVQLGVEITLYVCASSLIFVFARMVTQVRSISLTAIHLHGSYPYHTTGPVLLTGADLPAKTS